MFHQYARRFEIAGNTPDPSTVAAQIILLKEQFGVNEVVLAGNRGMIKSKGKAAVSAKGWKYITALTKAQVRTLLKRTGATTRFI